MASNTTLVSSYLAHLPALFQQDRDFMGRFLLGFEHLLSGVQPTDSVVPLTERASVEEQLERLYTTFVPAGPDPTHPEVHAAPEGFLPWLAGWVALSLREDLAIPERRRLISRMVSLYRYRGTKRGLLDLLKTFIQADSLNGIDIYEFEQPAHYFQVTIDLKVKPGEEAERITRIAQAIIDQEKPAHTLYALNIITLPQFGDY